MKKLVLAAIAVLGLSAGSAFAQSFAHEAPPAPHHSQSKSN
jgi:hypothetical protein